MRSYKKTITSTRQIIVEADNISRTVYIHHDADNEIVHIGGADVTDVNGFHVHKLETLSFFVPANENIYAIKDNSGDAVDIWVLTPDAD
jgi:hypothetical protein